jgi:dihydroorotase-like cyclic amidohydrolase
MQDLVIKNGLVVTPSGLLKGGLAVKEEIIVKVGADHELGDGRRIIDAEGGILFPGMFDPHFHLGNGDDVGLEAMREDFRLESREMAAAGVTTFATTTLYGSGSIVKSFEDTLACGQGTSLVDFKITCCVSTEDQVFEMRAAAKLGCVDFKFFTGYKGTQAELLSMTREGITLRTWYLACEQLAASAGRPFRKSMPRSRTCANCCLSASARPSARIFWWLGRNTPRASLKIYKFTITPWWRICSKSRSMSCM